MAFVMGYQEETTDYAPPMYPSHPLDQPHARVTRSALSTYPENLSERSKTATENTTRVAGAVMTKKRAIQVQVDPKEIRMVFAGLVCLGALLLGFAGRLSGPWIAAILAGALGVGLSGKGPTSSVSWLLKAKEGVKKLLTEFEDEEARKAGTK